MKLKNLMIAAGVGFLALGSFAMSQSNAPIVPFLHPTDLIQVVPFGQPSAQSQYATPPQITNQYGYYKSGANTAAGGNYGFGANVTYAMFENAGTIASLSVTLAANPADGAVNCVFAIGTITALTVSANTGQSINNAVSTLTALSRVCYLFSQSNATWDRSQ